MDTLASHALADSRTLPAIGLGTYGLTGDAGTAAIVSALDSGYRLLDTAYNYGNEEAVGAAIARSAVPRDEIIVTTKLPGRHHGYEQTLASFQESRRRLGLDVVDLYLIHWPLPRLDAYVDSWRAMIRLRDDGLVRSIGVSNFTRGHLERLAEETQVLPVVNQIELHPRFPQTELRAFHAEHGIVSEAWSPLARMGDLVDDPAVTGPAKRYGVGPAQVLLRWHLQIGSLPIPRSSSPARQRENRDLSGFALTADEVDALTALARDDGRLFGFDPVTHEEF